MKKTLRADLCFVGALLVAILGVPVVMRFFIGPIMEPTLFRVWGLQIYSYMFNVTPYICLALALLHVIITRRISGLFVFSEIILFLLGGIFTEFCLRPQDPLGDNLITGIIIGVLLMFIPAATFLLQAFGIFIVGQVERRKAKKNQAGS